MEIILSITVELPLVVDCGDNDPYVDFGIKTSNQFLFARQPTSERLMTCIRERFKDSFYGEFLSLVDKSNLKDTYSDNSNKTECEFKYTFENGKDFYVYMNKETVYL